MKIFTLALAAALALLAPTAAIAQDAAVAAAADVSKLDPEKLAVAREVIALAYPPETRTDTFSSMTAAIVDQVKSMRNKPSDDPELNKLLDRETDKMLGLINAMLVSHLPEILEGMAQAYASEFTLDEISGVRDFARTPPGRAFFKANISTVSSPYYKAALLPYMADLKAAQTQWTAELTEDLAQYIAAQQSKPKPRKGSGKAN